MNPDNNIPSDQDKYRSTETDFPQVTSSGSAPVTSGYSSSAGLPLPQNDSTEPKSSIDKNLLKVKYFRWWMPLGIGGAMIVALFIVLLSSGTLLPFILFGAFSPAALQSLSLLDILSLVLCFGAVLVGSVYVIKSYQQNNAGSSKPLWKIVIFVVASMLGYAAIGAVALFILFLIAMNNYASNK